MAESQSDRLKRELAFLKESYEAGIISEQEYTKGKTRIEGKLAEWGEGVVEKYGESESSSEDIFDNIHEIYIFVIVNDTIIFKFIKFFNPA